MKLHVDKEFYYRVNSTKQDLFSNYNTCKENVKRNNENIDLYEGEWIKIKQNDYITHIVKPIETLENVAKTYNISPEKIIKDNDLKIHKLYIGQVLKIYK